VGDGTTSVVLLAAEILKQVKLFVEDGLHPQVSFFFFKCLSFVWMDASDAPVSVLLYMYTHTDLNINRTPDHHPRPPPVPRAGRRQA
jgi:hypothetical protein